MVSVAAAAAVVTPAPGTVAAVAAMVEAATHPAVGGLPPVSAPSPPRVARRPAAAYAGGAVEPPRKRPAPAPGTRGACAPVSASPQRTCPASMPQAHVLTPPPFKPLPAGSAIPPSLAMAIVPTSTAAAADCTCSHTPIRLRRQQRRAPEPAGVLDGEEACR